MHKQDNIWHYFIYGIVASLFLFSIAYCAYSVYNNPQQYGPIIFYPYIGD